MCSITEHQNLTKNLRFTTVYNCTLCFKCMTSLQTLLNHTKATCSFYLGWNHSSQVFGNGNWDIWSHPYMQHSFSNIIGTRLIGLFIVWIGEWEIDGSATLHVLPTYNNIPVIVPLVLFLSEITPPLNCWTMYRDTIKISGLDGDCPTYWDTVGKSGLISGLSLQIRNCWQLCETNQTIAVRIFGY